MITQPTKFQNVIIPDPSFFSILDNSISIAKFTQEYLETIEQVRYFAMKNFNPISQKNFYYYYGAKQIGEERLAEYFQSKGYTVIRPETLPLEEQLNILSNCKSFASTLGSSSHNTIFMKDYRDIILIPRFFNKTLNYYQLTLDKVRDNNIYYIDSNLSLYSRSNQDLNCFVISEQLKKYFGDEWNGEYSEEDFVTFLNYIIYSHQYSKMQNQNFNVDIAKYYDPILPDFMAQLKKREDLLQKFGITIN